VLLSAGSAAFPVTQSALSQSAKEEIPLNAFVFGQGLEALDLVGVVRQMLAIRIGKITLTNLTFCLSIEKL
jgi:hypothetical protein